MGFNTKNIVVGGQTSKSDPPIINVELTSKQIEFLLITIKNSLFKGEYVEICYNTTLKLQEKFQELNKNK
jgi:hypothetical protein|tara:strand:- start:247 stop:456 length:210 start_codon:yes stop_codon:yes gene_type:complete